MKYWKIQENDLTEKKFSDFLHALKIMGIKVFYFSILSYIFISGFLAMAFLKCSFRMLYKTMFFGISYTKIYRHKVSGYDTCTSQMWMNEF